jgi:hypothetical protein
MRFLTSDGSARLALWLDAARLERALQARLGEPPCQRLEFSPGIDWTAAPAKAVWRAIAYLIAELRDPQGLTTDPIALETFTASLLQLILTRFEHNYTARLERPFHQRFGLVAPRRSVQRTPPPINPSHWPMSLLRRLRDGDAAHHIPSIRDTTPLAALHDIRLQHVRKRCSGRGRGSDTRNCPTLWLPPTRPALSRPTASALASIPRRQGGHPDNHSPDSLC